MSKRSKIDKSDLKAAQAELKQFRRDLAQLKKKGLIDAKLYDARRATPTKYVNKLIKEFGNVLRGEATPIKVSKSKQKYYKEKGYKIRNGRVIVPHKSNEKVFGTHDNFVVKTFSNTGEITRIDLGLSLDNIEQWALKLRKKKIKLKDNEEITFQFYGNNSYRGFVDFNDLVDYLEYYDGFQWAFDQDHEKQAEVISNIVIYRVDRYQRPEVIQDPVRAAWRREKRSLAREKWLDRMDESEYKRFLNRRAENQRNTRENMTPEKKEIYKTKARQRAAKHYAKVRNAKKDSENSGN